jgi:hypothetical protein
LTLGTYFTYLVLVVVDVDVVRTVVVAICKTLLQYLLAPGAILSALTTRSIALQFTTRFSRSAGAAATTEAKRRFLRSIFVEMIAEVKEVVGYIYPHRVILYIRRTPFSFSPTDHLICSEHVFDDFSSGYRKPRYANAEDIHQDVLFLQ